jgi:hypothetical protein
MRHARDSELEGVEQETDVGLGTYGFVVLSLAGKVVLNDP